MFSSGFFFLLQEKETNSIFRNPTHNLFFPNPPQPSQSPLDQFCSYDISLEVLIGLVCRISSSVTLSEEITLFHYLWSMRSDGFSFLLVRSEWRSRRTLWDRKVLSRRDPLKFPPRPSSAHRNFLLGGHLPQTPRARQLPLHSLAI